MVRASFGRERALFIAAGLLVLSVFTPALATTAHAATAALALPDAFADGSRSGVAGPDMTWGQVSVNGATLTIRMAVPDRWVAVSGIQGTARTLVSPDNTLIAIVAPPVPAPKPVYRLATAPELQAYSDAVSRAFGRATIAVGQAKIAGRYWSWIDLGDGEAPEGAPEETPDGAPDGDAPAAAASPTMAPPNTRLWVLTSTVHGQEVTLIFMVRHAAGMTAAAKEQHARDSGPVFARIMERLTFVQ